MDLTKDIQEKIKKIEQEWQTTKAQLSQATEAVGNFQTKLVDLQGQKRALDDVLAKLEGDKGNKGKEKN